MSSSLLDASEGLFEVTVTDKPISPETREAGKKAHKRLEKIFGDMLIKKEDK